MKLFEAIALTFGTLVTVAGMVTMMMGAPDHTGAVFIGAVLTLLGASILRAVVLEGTR